MVFEASSFPVGLSLPAANLSGEFNSLIPVVRQNVDGGIGGWTRVRERMFTLFGAEGNPGAAPMNQGTRRGGWVWDVYITAKEAGYHQAHRSQVQQYDAGSRSPAGPKAASKPTRQGAFAQRKCEEGRGHQKTRGTDRIVAHRMGDWIQIRPQDMQYNHSHDKINHTGNGEDRKPVYPPISPVSSRVVFILLVFRLVFLRLFLLPWLCLHDTLFSCILSQSFLHCKSMYTTKNLMASAHFI